MIQWLCQQVQTNRTSYQEFNKEFLKKTTNQCNKIVSLEIVNDNTVIVYDDMDNTDKEVEVNEV